MNTTSYLFKSHTIMKNFYLTTTAVLFLLFSFQFGYSQCPVLAPVPNNACYQSVIANDSWCCFNSWDGLCQSAYDACAPTGGCPVLAPVPNNACYQTVIANDPWCCNNSWDGLCQSAYDACNPGGGPVSAGDCPDAIPICTINNFSIDPNGFGTTNELCTGCVSNPSTNPASANSGCLLSGELNSTWFTVAVVAGGTMEFSFGAPGGGNCYDWAMWSYTDLSTCSNIASNNLAPVRCNWNGNCDSYTGIGPTPPGGFANNFEPVMNVNAGDQFVICFSNYSSAVTGVPIAFSGSANIDCIPLSVDWKSFSATDMRGYNVVEWSTFAEFNCSHFELEQSTNGSDFNQIATIQGNGTTIQESSYSFEDFNPGEELTYYRLKQIDGDGGSKYSNIIVVSQAEADALKIVKAYPNPTSDVFNLQITLPESTNLTIVMTEFGGREVFTKREAFHSKGGNLIQIPVSDYEKGLYFVTIYDELNNTEQTVKLSVF